VVGADWRIGIDDAWDRIGHDRAIQGNLDPTTLLGPVARMYRQVDDIVARVNRRPGHIFICCNASSSKARKCTACSSRIA
jgi:uroporphyrinogen decarboxylase